MATKVEEWGERPARSHARVQRPRGRPRAQAPAGGQKRRRSWEEVYERRSLLQKLRSANSRAKLWKDKFTKLNASKQAGLLQSWWFARAALAHPNICPRLLAISFAEEGGEGMPMVSRSYISTIRDAFVEVLKQFNAEELSSTLAAYMRQAEGTSASPSSIGAVPLVLLHVHDEASMRLRSRIDPFQAKPSRSRSSKIQQHAITVHIGEHKVGVLSELEALLDKSAGTLATSLDRALRQVCDALAMRDAHGPEIWVVHIIVGDGVATNEAASRRVLQRARDEPISGATKYFMASLKCAAHQASLAAKTATVGAGARVGVGQTEDGMRAANQTCGAAVRLFKYLLAEYWDEFVAATRSYITENLRILPSAHSQADQVDEAHGLQVLYTQSVVPTEVLCILNNGLVFEHVADFAAESHSQEESEAIINSLSDCLTQHVFHVDEHPAYALVRNLYLGLVLFCRLSCCRSRRGAAPGHCVGFENRY